MAEYERFAYFYLNQLPKNANHKSVHQIYEIPAESGTVVGLQFLPNNILLSSFFFSFSIFFLSFSPLFLSLLFHPIMLTLFIYLFVVNHQRCTRNSIKRKINLYPTTHLTFTFFVLLFVVCYYYYYYYSFEIFTKVLPPFAGTLSAVYLIINQNIITIIIKTDHNDNNNDNII